MANIATTKISESDNMIVWEMALAPGEGTGVHTHHHSYMFYVTQGSIIEIQDEHGQSLNTISINTGDVLEFQLEGNQLVCTDENIPPLPATHQAYNRGENNYTEVLVEIRN